MVAIDQIGPAPRLKWDMCCDLSVWHSSLNDNMSSADWDDRYVRHRLPNRCATRGNEQGGSSWIYSDLDWRWWIYSIYFCDGSTRHGQRLDSTHETDGTFSDENSRSLHLNLSRTVYMARRRLIETTHATICATHRETAYNTTAHKFTKQPMICHVVILSLMQAS